MLYWVVLSVEKPHLTQKYFGQKVLQGIKTVRKEGNMVLKK